MFGQAFETPGVTSSFAHSLGPLRLDGFPSSTDSQGPTGPPIPKTSPPGFMKSYTSSALEKDTDMDTSYLKTLLDLHGHDVPEWVPFSSTPSVKQPRRSSKTGKKGAMAVVSEPGDTKRRQQKPRWVWSLCADGLKRVRATPYLATKKRRPLDPPTPGCRRSPRKGSAAQVSTATEDLTAFRTVRSMPLDAPANLPQFDPFRPTAVEHALIQRIDPEIVHSPVWTRTTRVLLQNGNITLYQHSLQALSELFPYVFRPR
jgi:hypothetical protein